MHKLIIVLVLLFSSRNCFSGTMDVPESTRLRYALKFHEAFIAQSFGYSTRSFEIFKEAYQEALRVGETVQKVALIEDLFK